MEISDWIWAAVGVVELGWAARLWRLGLARSYPFLTSYLVFSAVHSAVSFAAYNTWGRNSAAYGQLWAVTQPVLWVMLFCVVIEAYNHMLRGYEGLQRLGQWGSHIALGTVALIVLAMVVLDPPVDGAISPWGIFWVHQERSVYLGLTAICLVLVSVGAYYGLVISRNIATVFAVFGLFFLSQAGLLVFRDHLGAEFYRIRHTVTPILYIMWVIAGAVAFTRVGEERPADETSAAWGGASGTTGHLTQQLESVNQLLLRVLRS